MVESMTRKKRFYELLDAYGWKHELMEDGKDKFILEFIEREIKKEGKMKTKKSEKAIDAKLFQEFITWGSGFTLEAERDYKRKGRPFIFHLTVYCLWVDNDENEFVSTNINVVMKRAIKLIKSEGRNHQIKRKEPEIWVVYNKEGKIVVFGEDKITAQENALKSSNHRWTFQTFDEDWGFLESDGYKVIKSKIVPLKGGKNGRKRTK